MATICLLLGYGVILPITFVPCEECFPWIGKSLESVLRCSWLLTPLGFRFGFLLVLS